MKENLDFKDCEPVNYLWNEFLNYLGPERAIQAVRQARDLNKMRGGKETLPVLFTKTGGIALTTFDKLRTQTGLSIFGNNLVLLYSSERKVIQILHEIESKY
tara:strand:- start:4219 stop:4524 length:306 start_codon:yes stop_codon:yes gene_type:complete